MKSCSSCPSYIEADDEVRDRFKKGIGAPMCGRFGNVLGYQGQPDSDRQNTLLAFASDCDGYGLALPSHPVSINPRVALPSEDIVGEGPTGLACNSCHACRNLVKHNAVYDQYKWPVPLCKAKGLLVFDPIREAKDCAWATPGMPSETLWNVEIRQEYTHGFTVDAQKAFEALVGSGNLNIEPTTYETDSPVDPEDEADGIRAWRKIECPWGTGKVIHLPIFDPSHWSEDQQKLIPKTNDANHPELYVDYSNLLWRFAVSTWQRRKTLLIQSLPGLGKTQFVNYLGWLCQMPVTRIFFTDKIEWDDIFGKMVLQKKDGVAQTLWQDGRYTEAHRHGGFITVDEPNLAPNEIISTLRTSTEPNGMLYLDAGISEVDGEKVELVIPAHKYTMPVWCANPAWDPRNLGTKELAAADISRLAPAYLEPPPSAIEKHIIRTTVKETEGFEIPEPLLDDLLKVSDDLRELSKTGEFPGTWGIRENIDVAGNLAWYPFEEAFRMTALNYYEPETAAFVVENSIKTIRVTT